MKNYYKVLGIPSDSSQEEIKKAYRNLAKKWHPDVNKDPIAENRFKEINEAYEALTRTDNDISFFRFNIEDFFGNQPFQTVKNSELRISFNGQITNEDVEEIKKMLITRGCRVVGQSIVRVS